MWSFLILCAFLAPSCTRRLPLPSGASWYQKSGVFRWWAGEVRLPAGFNYQVDQGTDTFEGHFTSPDGKLIVRHDIGGYAGAWATKEDALLFEERIVEGARMWTARRKVPDGKEGTTTRMAVTFPDNGCANFYVTSSNGEDAVPIDTIARSFRPKGKPSESCVDTLKRRLIP